MLKVCGVDKVLSVDLQRPGQNHEACFFDGRIPAETIDSNNLFIDYMKDRCVTLSFFLLFFSMLMTIIMSILTCASLLSALSTIYSSLSQFWSFLYCDPIHPLLLSIQQ
jgi:hypothetical protein